MTADTRTLVLLRHGQSEWNLAGKFTGWIDVGLTEQGEREAAEGGRLMLEEGIVPDVLHTSVQKRAIHTAELALRALDRSWIPVHRSWRLNERHYGALQGKGKKETSAEYGVDQVKIWRRSYDTPPPPLDEPTRLAQGDDPRYADLAPDLLPGSECLADVVERMLPYWFDGIVPDLEAGRVVLVAAHGNSLRGLVQHLDGMSEDEIVALDIPTGIPLVYELDAGLRPIGRRYLGDPEAAAAAAAAVAKQAG